MSPHRADQTFLYLTASEAPAVSVAGPKPGRCRLDAIRHLCHVKMVSRHLCRSERMAICEKYREIAAFTGVVVHPRWRAACSSPGGRRPTPRPSREEHDDECCGYELDADFDRAGPADDASPGVLLRRPG